MAIRRLWSELVRCFLHPERETWVHCEDCHEPICEEDCTKRLHGRVLCPEHHIRRRRSRARLRWLEGLVVITIALGVGLYLRRLIEPNESSSVERAPTTSSALTVPPRRLPVIVFSSDRQANWDIYSINTDTFPRVEKRLTDDPAEDNYPAASANSPETPIAFHSNRDGNFEIYTMSTDGSDESRLTFSPANDIEPDWSPRDDAIVFVSDRDGNPEIYTMKADGTSQTRVTNNPWDDSFPAWSRDTRLRTAGTDIAFMSNRDGNYEIYRMTSDGSSQTRLTATAADDFDASWSPDGGRIVFVSERDAQREIYVMNADGTGQRNLTNNPGEDGGPQWSPDGTRITFESERGGVQGNYSIRGDGTDLRPEQRGPR